MQSVLAALSDCSLGITLVLILPFWILKVVCLCCGKKKPAKDYPVGNLFPPTIVVYPPVPPGTPEKPEAVEAVQDVSLDQREADGELAAENEG